MRSEYGLKVAFPLVFLEFLINKPSGFPLQKQAKRLILRLKPSEIIQPTFKSKQDDHMPAVSLECGWLTSKECNVYHNHEFMAFQGHDPLN